jgi:glycosyltransferase involved in cell wall biosynthesis
MNSYRNSKRVTNFRKDPSADTSPTAKRIVGLFPDITGLGGVQESSRQTICALEEIVAGTNWRGSYLGLNDPPGNLTLAKVAPGIGIEGFGRNKFRFVARAIECSRNTGQIVLAAHPNLAVVASVARLLRSRLKVIVVTHGIEIWNKLPVHRRRALLAADLVLATSQFNFRCLIDVQKIDPRKIRLVHWPLNPMLLRLADRKASLPLPSRFPEGRVILSVGRWSSLERYKGADELIRAFAKIRMNFHDLSLVFVGGGDDLPRLKQLVSEAGIAGSTYFLEGLSTEELAACYANAEIFALPSWGEGFGIVFLEAMAFGLPVIGVAAGGAIDILQDESNSLVVPGRDFTAVAKALDRLLGSPELRNNLGREGAEMVRRNYRFEMFRSNLEGVLRECGFA